MYSLQLSRLRGGEHRLLKSMVEPDASGFLSPLPFFYARNVAMPVILLIFAYAILLNGSSIVAMHGRYAVRLDLPGSAIIPWLPWVALAAYVLVFAILRLKLGWRWRAFVAATVLGHLIIVYPITVLDRGAVPIPVAASLSQESQQAFEAKYPDVKWVAYSSSGEGRCIRIRRDDYSQELAAFVSELAGRQREQGEGGAH